MSTNSHEKRPDVIVVGAGLIGLTSALALQAQGFSVLVIDRDEPGPGASCGNAGYLATELIDPMASAATLRNAPHLLLDPHGPLALPPRYLLRLLPWMSRFVLAAGNRQVAEGRRALAALNGHALAAWQRCLAGIGASDELIASGYLMVWEKAEGMKSAQVHQRHLNQYGIAAELLDQTAVRQRDPGLGRSIHHALLFPNAHQVSDPYRVVQQLASAVRRLGGCITKEQVTTVQAEEQGVEVITTQRRHRAARLLIACGAWSARLTEQLGLSMPLEAEAGHHLTLPERPGALRQPIGSAERNVVLTPMRCGLRVVGFSEWGGLDLKANPKRSRTLKYHARALLNDDTGVGQAQDWMGYRPTLPDSLPVVGQHPNHPQIQFAFGHQHLGLTQAAITAELIAQQATGQPPALDLTPFRPDRFTRPHYLPQAR